MISSFSFPDQMTKYSLDQMTKYALDFRKVCELGSLTWFISIMNFTQGVNEISLAIYRILEMFYFENYYKISLDLSGFDLENCRLCFSQFFIQKLYRLVCFLPKNQIYYKALD